MPANIDDTGATAKHKNPQAMARGTSGAMSGLSTSPTGLTT